VGGENPLEPRKEPIMAEDKTKKDLKAAQADEIAETITLKKAKADLAETHVVTGDNKAKKNAVKSKIETADMVTPQDDEPKIIEAEKTTKAGKRSAKGIKEAEEKQAKLERQQSDSDEDSESKPKAPVKPARSRLERRSKNYREVAKLIDAEKSYTLKEAIALLPKLSKTKFDATTELHVRLNVDPRQADQNIRDTVVLPAGTGKTVRVAVFADTEDAATAKKAGADIAGSDDLLQQLDKGTIDFDVLISSPQMMSKLGKYARVLGPKGLMPNPKSGTVTNDVKKAVQEAKAGRVEYRVDSNGIVHVGFGKVSFATDKLTENATALLQSIKSNKPSSIKGSYFVNVYVTVSMGPSVKIDLSDVASV